MKLLHTTTIAKQLNQFLRDQAPYARSIGIEHETYAISAPGPEQETFAAREGFLVRSVDMKRKVSPLHDLVAVFRMWRILREIRPTIVHGHSPKGGLLGMISAWLARVPVKIYTIHGLWYVSGPTGWQRSLVKFTERISCTLADQVLSVSPSVERQAAEDGLCPPEKIKTLRYGSSNGVDADGRYNPARFTVAERSGLRQELGIPEDAFVLGFVGRIFRVKGVAEIEEAWQRLRLRYPNAYLLFVGPFDLQNRISPEAEQRLRDDDRVVIAGEVKDASPYYSVMDLFLLPSYQEGFGAVLIEAAAMEVPTITTNVLGCVDAIEDGVTGTIVPSHDSQALYDAISVYAEDPTLRERHGKAGRARVLEKFRQEDIWEAIYHEYFRLMEAKGLPVSQPVNASVAPTR